MLFFGDVGWEMLSGILIIKFLGGDIEDDKESFF